MEWGLSSPGGLSESPPGTGHHSDRPTEAQPSRPGGPESDHWAPTLRNLNWSTFLGKEYTGELWKTQAWPQILASAPLSRLQSYPGPHLLILSRTVNAGLELLCSHLLPPSALNPRHSHQRARAHGLCSKGVFPKSEWRVGYGLGSMPPPWTHPKVPNFRPDEQTGAARGVLLYLRATNSIWLLTEEPSSYWAFLFQQLFLPKGLTDFNHGVK